MTDEDSSRTLRDHLAAALDAAAPGLTARLDTDPQAHLDLVAVVRDAQSETDALLRATVDSARGAGCTWDQIGGVLGMTRQAAQQRYGRRNEGLDTTGPHTMTLAPLTAFNEMRVLERAGRHGWHSIGYGPLFHVVAHSEQQWQHLRTTILSKAPLGEGWKQIGAGWGWWSYYARPLEAVALPGPDDVRELLAP
ncbi:hypothetical protein SAMN05216410_0724 [Sanguibacter gelidistatuariae]|uniref:Uncharacterized protein n=1 Tax=Sanguibacter gelidistatuariae TaxID=1814289 RepID=A0A1G6H4Q6_9MICO|nr:hypothetical protein [Sanguibacter gelidistatuariae]SDB89161.1 hypothetical protein SAMN05216410_0724 [Sanguibacter gelidistatuariae]